jgi:hypothetical protein
MRSAELGARSLKGRLFGRPRRLRPSRGMLPGPSRCRISLNPPLGLELALAELPYNSAARRF